MEEINNCYFVYPDPFSAKQEILKNLQAANSLSPPSPSPFLKEKKFY